MDFGTVWGQLRLTLVCTCLFRCEYSLFSWDGFSISLILLEAIFCTCSMRSLFCCINIGRNWLENKRWLYPLLLFPACACLADHMVAGSAQSFSSVRLASGSHRQTQMQLDSWTPGQGAWHVRDMLGVPYMCCVIWALLCIWLGSTGNSKDKWKVWVHFVLKPLLLYQSAHHRVNPSWWAWCDQRGLGGLCARWPSVFMFPQPGFPAHGMGFPRHKHGSPGTCSGAVWQGCGCGTSPYGAQLCLSLKGVT